MTILPPASPAEGVRAGPFARARCYEWARLARHLFFDEVIPAELVLTNQLTAERFVVCPRCVHARGFPVTMQTRGGAAPGHFIFKGLPTAHDAYPQDRVGIGVTAVARANQWSLSRTSSATGWRPRYREPSRTASQGSNLFGDAAYGWRS